MGLSKDFIDNLYRLQLPPMNVSRAGWKFDQPAILAAINEMGITLPVILKFRQYKTRVTTGWRTYAMHGVRYIDPQRPSAGLCHLIKVNDTLKWELKKCGTDITIDKVSEHLWHELRHAQQSEEWGKYFGESPILFSLKAYRHPDAQGKWGATYRENIYEVDAREFAESKRGSLLVVAT
jgi:hypothetical protein